MNGKRYALTLTLLLFPGPGHLFAQTTGKIVGVVKDNQTGDVLPGANIVIDATSLGAASDLNGHYIILRVPPGNHTLTAQFLGYQTVRMEDVQVLTDLTTTVDFSLKPQALEVQEVVITAKNPLVRKDLTSSEARVQAAEIEVMAVQDVDQILTLQAGVTTDAGGDLHIRGGRSTEIAYMLNGISITDDFSREQAVTVENASVQELQVISGTFNAEYGNAMSGVINIVTKDGGNDFNARLEAWTGDYLSNRSDTFWNINDISPVADYNLQASISGPIVKDRLTYFFMGRRFKTDGWFYGPNAFSPQGRLREIDGELVAVRGDSNAVAMNPEERWSGQGTLKWKMTDPLSLKIDFLGSTSENRWYNHSYRLNPTGLRGASGYGATLIAKLTHVLAQNTFYDLTGSYKQNENKSQLYDDPFDPRYVHPDSLTAGANSFFKAGTDLFREKNVTKSLIGKLDFTSQVTQRHLLKAGIEFQKDVIDFENITLVPAVDESGLQIVPFQPSIQSISSTNHNRFQRKPDKFAAYVQDKIEYQSVVINIGLRFDYFNSNGHIPADPQDPNVFNPLKLSNIYTDSNGDGVISTAEQTPANEYTLEERESFWYEKASPKTQLSPRVGIAYPITDAGVIHFSYGIFQQIPAYDQLYTGDQLKLSEGQGIWGPFGNPDLNPQRTTMYELGLKQQISENIGVDITGYYRDIRDWISTTPAIPTHSTGISYSTTTNRDFANVKGITVSVTRRLANHYGFDFDYTYQVVKGTNSSPEDEYFALTTGAEPRKQLSPLNWDQRHAANLSFYFSRSSWGFNLISRYQSGQPYTPAIVAGTLTGQNVLSGLATNTRLKPNRFTVDLNAYKSFKLSDVNLEFFLRAFNLFDSNNPINVFEDSGKADFSVFELSGAEADPTWYDRPDFYSEPRRVQIGMRLYL